jgi:predicted SAM-dependent methyltransferase
MGSAWRRVLGLGRRPLLSLFDHQTVALLRWDLHLLSVRFWNCILLRRRALEETLLRAPGPVFLNLGSGPKGKVDPHWINIDGAQYPNVHFLADLNRPLPFPDNSFDGIYSEHVLEHFTLEQGRGVLAECLRILRPGGCLRLIVPDGQILVDWYLNTPERLSRERPSRYNSAMESLNSYFRQRYEHKLIYDATLMTSLLLDLGFQSPRQESFKSGAISEMYLLDDERYRDESLYLEALKPGTSR